MAGQQQQQLEEPPPYQPAAKTASNGRSPKGEASRASPYSARYAPISQESRRSRSPQSFSDTSKRSRLSPISSQYSSTELEASGQVAPLILPPAPTHDPSQVPSPRDSGNAMTVDQLRDPRSTSTSIEDPDDRMAAEALCGLGKVEPNTSPTRSNPAQNPTPPLQPPPTTLTDFSTPLQYYPIGISHTHPGSSPSQQSEPLLSLLTTSHPWLGGTLNGSLSAYSSTKSYTPRFVQRGADIVENTVGSVGRATGVEGSIRRYLEPREGRTMGDVERPDEEMLDRDASTPTHGRQQRKPSQTSATSHDSLPLYDDNRSPAYTESLSLSSPINKTRHGHLPQQRSWSSQLMISTSGLGAALNDASLRSLKTCLALLSNANRHLRALMEALRRVLDDWDAYLLGSSPSQSSSSQSRDQKPAPAESGDAMEIDPPASREEERKREAAAIASRIKQLNAEIFATLKAVVKTVSRHTGGALPENASLVVRWQLLSVPGRWKRAVASSRGQNGVESTGPQERNAGDASITVDGSESRFPSTGEKAQAKAPTGAIIHSAHAMLAFAVEGLEMMEQVGGVVESTIGSAERWLDSMGRQGQNGSSSMGPQPAQGLEKVVSGGT